MCSKIMYKIIQRKAKILEFDILNNEKYIYSHSSKELIDILYEFPKQFKKAEKIFSSYNIELKSDYKNILILGV